MEALLKKFKKQSSAQLQKRLPKLEGKELEAANQVLLKRGVIDVIPDANESFESGIDIGDTVTFKPAKNSKHRSRGVLKGIVVRNKNKDPKTGKKYFVVKVEGLGHFHKQQTSVTKIDE